MPFTLTELGKMLEAVHFKNSYTAGSTFYLGLSSTTPTTSGGNITEPTTGGYARIAVTGSMFNAASNGTITNSIALAWPAATSGGYGAAITYFFATDTASGAGTVKWYAPLPMSKTIAVGDSLQLPAGAATSNLVASASPSPSPSPSPAPSPTPAPAPAPNPNTLSVPSTTMTEYDFKQSWSSAEGGYYNGMSGTVNGARSRAVAALSSITALGKTPVVTTVLMSLGFNDEWSSETAPRFEADMTALIARMRADLPLSGAEFVIPRVGPNGGSTVTTVRTAVANIAAADSGVTVVNTDGLDRNAADNLHFRLSAEDSIGSSAYDASVVTAASDSSKAVVLWVGGDSNANGQGDDMASYAATYTTSANIKILTYTGTWATYAPGTWPNTGIINQGTNGGTGVGPEIGFIRRFRAAYPSATLYIIKEGQGGSYATRGTAAGTLTGSVSGSVLTVTAGTNPPANTLLTGSGVPTGLYVSGPISGNTYRVYLANSTVQLVAPAPSPAPSPSPAPAPSPTPGPDANQSITFTTAPTTAITNPERGWYGWGGSFYLNSFDSGSLGSLLSSGVPMAIGLIDLSSFVSSNITTAYLTALQAKFDLVRAAKVKVIIRPVYNYSGTNPATEASQAWILTHISQLAPIMAANADVIAIFQAGFVGAFGEWHSSNIAGNAAAKLAIKNALLANWPSTHQVAFRYMGDIITWYPTVASLPMIGTGSDQSRVALHNDCFLAGTTDSGTYDTTRTSVTTANQRIYAAALGEVTSFGGELCGDAQTPWRTADSDIMTEGAYYNLSYLNSSPNSGQPWLNTSTGAWVVSGIINTVARQMGYRFQLDSLSYPDTASGVSDWVATLSIRNVGWGRPLQSRPIYVGLRNTSSGAIIWGTAGNLTTLAPNATGTTQLVASIPIAGSGAATGTYEPVIHAPDRNASLASIRQYKVKFANANAGSQTWDDTNGYFRTGGTVTIGSTSPPAGGSSSLTLAGSVAHGDMSLPGATWGWMLTPNATPITKYLGISISQTAVGTAPTSDTTMVPTISYTGGTPTDTGSINTGLLSSWGSTLTGIKFSIPLTAGQAYTITIPVVGYGVINTVTASLADSSAANVVTTVDCLAATSAVLQRVSFTCTPAANTTLNVQAVQTYCYAAGAGDSRYQGIWVY
jgi:hypothetical protein